MDILKILKKGKKAIILASVLLLFLILVIVPFYSYKSFLNRPISKSSKEVEFQVKKGASSPSIVEGLYKRGLIKNKLFAKIYLKKLNLDKSLKPGIYKLNTTMTPLEIFTKLAKGTPDVDVVTLTFPEGYSIRQISKKLLDAGLIKDEEAFIVEAQNGSFDYEFLKGIPNNRPSRLEGYLFPDTYEFKKGLSEHEIIVKMLDRFKFIYTSYIKGDLEKSGKELDKVMIMASLVEREAKVEGERPIIAAVFYNRLKIDKKLESCATIQYALGVNKERLLYKDLEIESPYNTYKHVGLPVGPICNPGKDSIKAALNPAKVNYLYFVLKAYNGDGSHNFTNSYDQFLKYKSQLK